MSDLRQFNCSLADQQFLKTAIGDIQHYLLRRSSNYINSVLVFPPVNSHRRFLIHQLVEHTFAANNLKTFSIGQNNARRTIICHESLLTARNNQSKNPAPWATTNDKMMTVVLNKDVKNTNNCGQNSRTTSGSRVKAMPPLTLYRPPAARNNANKNSVVSPLSINNCSHENATSPRPQVQLQATPINHTRRLRRPDQQVYIPRARRSETNLSNSCETPKAISLHHQNLTTTPHMERIYAPIVLKRENVRGESSLTKNDKNGNNSHLKNEGTSPSLIVEPKFSSSTDTSYRLSESLRDLQKHVSRDSDLISNGFECDSVSTLLNNEQTEQAKGKSISGLSNTTPTGFSINLDETCVSCSSKKNVTNDVLSNETLDTSSSDCDYVISDSSDSNRISMSICTNLSVEDSPQVTSVYREKHVPNETVLDGVLNSEVVVNNVTSSNKSCVLESPHKVKRKESCESIVSSDAVHKTKQIHLLDDVIDDDEIGVVNVDNNVAFVADSVEINKEEIANDESKMVVEEGDWDTLFDDEGNCLDSSLLDELSVAVGQVKMHSANSDYRAFQSIEERSTDGECIIEIYDFPAEFKTRDILSIFAAYKSRGNFQLRWVDDTHALGVFNSPIIADEVLQSALPFVKTRPLKSALPESRMKARTIAVTLPPIVRPKTCPVLARRLVSGALGLRIPTDKKKQEEEKLILKEARDQKRLAAKLREAAWEGTIGN